MSTPSRAPSRAPSFSIVICNYNYAQFVGQAIDSALAQRYPADKVEVVVVDDGSTDDSLAVLARYRDHPQVKVLQQPNRGQTAAFDAGVRAATGELVCLLDSDDLCLPDKLARVAAWIASKAIDTERLFLCHDLILRDERTGESALDTWFQIVGIDKLDDIYDLDGRPMFFPFSVPTGLVFGRTLITECLAAIPAWAFPRGADGALCPAALIRSGCVHYLRQSLGIYRIHSANEFGSLRNGRYAPRIDLRDRTPRQLHFLDQWVDMADLEPAHHARARSYFRRWEKLQRMPTGDRGVAAARISIALIGRGDAAGVSASVTSALDQRYPACEVLLPAALSCPATPDGADIRRYDDGPEGADALTRLIAAARAASGESIVFLPVGDRLDRDFVERHLFYRQYGALVGVTCSDIRLITPGGELVHQNAFAQSGAWAQAVQQIPPFATGLTQWVAPPLAACMFRRDLLVELAGAPDGQPWPADMAEAGGWWPVQLALHTSGLLRFRETLCSVRLASGTQASYGWLSAPHTPDGRVIEPAVAGVTDWLRSWHGGHQGTLAARLPDAWQQRFPAWLDAQRG